MVTISTGISGRSLTALTAAATGLCWLLAAASCDAVEDQDASGPRYYYPLHSVAAPQAITADVCVYGATPGGVTAAIQASRMGKKAVLMEFGRHIGGMTASGLSDTDGGETAITGGIAAEFYALAGHAHFRPSLAERTFRALLDQAHVPVYVEQRLAAVTKSGNAITSISFEGGTVVTAAMYIDATYEGDLLAQAGVTSTTAREGNAAYHETINGVMFGPKDNFDRAVDPYIVPGQPSSGLLPGISADAPGTPGQADHRLQAYNFRMWLVPAAHGKPWPKPAEYDANRYSLLLRYIAAGCEHIAIHAGDNNNHHFFNGAFSTDDIGMNYDWPEADYPTREKIFQEHVAYQQGLMWFLAHDERVPSSIRGKIAAFGLPTDEFTDSGGWPFQLYVREARRMVSDYVMTEQHGDGTRIAEDPIALASYSMDSHNTARVVVHGAVSNEGQTYKHVPHPFPLSYRAIVPKRAECGNILVLFCVSSSHTGITPLRMEPVLMITGQSAATAACLAIDARCDVQQLEYARLRDRLIADKQILVVTNSH
jgi:hypothetical protein